MKRALLSKNDTQHIAWIDLLRSFAICCVILVHATENVYPFEVEFMNGAGLHTRIFGFTLFTIGRLGVPLFFYITGYLLLHRDYTYEKTTGFWKRNFLGLLVTTEIWIVLYHLFLIWFRKEGFHPDVLIKNMLFLRSVDMTHMWYMNKILGIYIFIPFVAILLKKIDLKLLRFPVILAGAYLFLVPTIHVVMVSLGHEGLSMLLDLQFGGGVYGFLVLMGYFARKGVFRKVKNSLLWLMAVAAIVLAILLQLGAYHCKNGYNVWYDCIFILVATLAIFELVSRMDQIPFHKIWSSLAKCSFGIYLVHNVLVMVLNRYLHIGSAGVKIAVICILSLAISWVFVALIGRIPKLGKVLFFMK